MDDRLEKLLSCCLLLDLETGPDGTVHKIGAIRRDATFLRQGGFENKSTWLGSPASTRQSLVHRVAEAIAWSR